VTEIDDQIERFRDLRRRLETAVLPLATSVDGRRFAIQASLHGLELRAGGYVALEDGETIRLGQVLGLELTEVEGPELGGPVGEGNGFQARSRIAIRAARGHGVVLDGPPVPFHDARARPASPGEVSAWLERTRPSRATLMVGELALSTGTPLELDAGGFDRHTFLCGQSGSGKTYALGTLLERLLLETSLRIVVLDPNSDFVRLREGRAGADTGLADRYATAAKGVVVRSAAERGRERLRLRYPELAPATQAASLRLNPVADPLEYAQLVELVERGRQVDAAEAAASVGDWLTDEYETIGRRVRNLGIHSWRIWARADDGSLLDELAASGPRCLVVDLGSLDTREEQALVAEAVLARLWERRTEREPLLLVIDEAHNVCPQLPDSAQLALATEHAVRIAGEGRKFGIYLLVVTQRPQKVHENVVSQCDNLILMRMNSLADLAYVGDVLSYAPRGLVELAATFRQGEALVAGKLVSHPTLGRFGARLSEEGGSDVPADWAAPG
jgi:hypothetical protein